MKEADEALRRRNKRHIYNVGDYLMIQEEKARLVQCFAHTHRRKPYGFLIVDIVGRCLDSENDNEWLMDPVLDLPVYRITGEQRIYPISYLSHNTVYLIEAPDEPDWQPEEAEYLLHCTWGVDYL